MQKKAPAHELPLFSLTLHFHRDLQVPELVLFDLCSCLLLSGRSWQSAFCWRVGQLVPILRTLPTNFPKEISQKPQHSQQNTRPAVRQWVSRKHPSAGLCGSCLTAENSVTVFTKPALPYRAHLLTRVPLLRSLCGLACRVA